MTFKNYSNFIILSLFAAACLASVFQWNHYYFGFKPGNYLLLGSLFVASAFLFSFFAKPKEKYTPYVLTAYGILSIFYPVLIHVLLPTKQYISLCSFIFILCSAFLVSQVFYDKKIKAFLLTLLLALCIHIVSFEFSPYFLNLAATILLLLQLILERQLRKQKWLAITLVVVISIYSFFKLGKVGYYELQSKIDQKIEKQYSANGIEYTITKVRDFKNVYKRNKLLFSSADIFMFYEAFIHSAFQLKPDANEVLYVGESDVAVREILKHKTIDLTLSSNRENLPSQSFDVIFVDTDSLNSEKFALCGSLLTKNGIIVIRNNPSECLIDHLFKKNFHVALPSLNESTWKILAKDLSFFDRKKTLNKPLNTRWYTSDTYSLISNHGKYSGIDTLKE